MDNNNHKPMTLDNLALMVADGFNDLGGRIDKVENRLDKVENRLGKVENRIGKLEDKVNTLSNEVTGLHSSVNNYLQLSDKRYLELKRRDRLMAQWIELIAKKSGVPIDLGELETVD